MSRQYEDIDNKCRQAGCDAALAKKHAYLYLHESWDVHPPAEFIHWLRKFQKAAGNAVPAWNSGLCRAEYYEWCDIGQPDPPKTSLEPFNMKECADAFRASMKKIEGRMTHSKKDVVVVEDTRLKGYDERPPLALPF